MPPSLSLFTPRSTLLCLSIQQGIPPQSPGPGISPFQIIGPSRCLLCLPFLWLHCALPAQEKTTSLPSLRHLSFPAYWPVQGHASFYSLLAPCCAISLPRKIYDPSPSPRSLLCLPCYVYLSSTVHHPGPLARPRALVRDFYVPPWTSEPLSIQLSSICVSRQVYHPSPLAQAQHPFSSALASRRATSHLATLRSSRPGKTL